MVKRMLLVAIRRLRYITKYGTRVQYQPLLHERSRPGCTGITSRSVGREPKVYVVYWNWIWQSGLSLQWCSFVAIERSLHDPYQQALQGLKPPYRAQPKVYDVIRRRTGPRRM